MLVGSVASILDSSGDVCAGSHAGVDRQRINGTSFVFFAAVPVHHAISASEGFNIQPNTPSILSMLQENVRAILVVLYRVEAFTVPSRAGSPIIHILLRSQTPSASGSVKLVKPATPPSL